MLNQTKGQAKRDVWSLSADTVCPGFAHTSSSCNVDGAMCVHLSLCGTAGRRSAGGGKQ